ncbi:aminotransferase class I/II-fold pyridoxal phosphate-dependent enzyme [Streptomyces sp. NPDC049590]|uniref:aminotransferase class I/II-fold pyridoxal phosphate-dependent enzyme n=1 Tax=Streptomyces sp. NPDC049590 TaxID=3154834 RepID=UPI0034394756
MSGVDEGRDTVEPPARGSDFLQLAAGDVPAGGKAEWLAGRLRAAIADGRLPVGGRLPPTRVLAADLRVSRGVVTEAYRRLAEDGQTAGRRRAGTIVLAAPFLPPPSPAPAPGSGPGGAKERGVRGAGRDGSPLGLRDGDGPGVRETGGHGGPPGLRNGDGPGVRETGGHGDPPGLRNGDGPGIRQACGHGGPPEVRDAGEPGDRTPVRLSGGASTDPGRTGPVHGVLGDQGPARPSPGTPAHRSPAKPTDGTPAHQSPDGPFHHTPAHQSPAKSSPGTPAHRSPGRATGRSPAHHSTARPAHGVPAGPDPASIFRGVPGVDVFDALRAAPADVDFTPGRPDLTAFPRAAWLRAERAVLSGSAADQLGYGDPRGAPPLRRAVADWLARMRGVRVDPESVLIVAGTAQALTLLHPVLRADGVDAVAVEDPGSLGARQHLANGGLATPPVPVDEDGVRVDALRATGARAVLLTPAHQFPTGVVTSGERRRELLEWAREGGLILEDDYDAEHRYDRPPVPALRALLADRVCYLGSASKLLAPALRTGWLVAPAGYHSALVDAKRFNDLGNAVLPQLVLARLMASGELERHLRLVRGRHRGRRDAMIAALAARLPGAVVHGAAAGLHLTVTYAGDVPDTEFAAAALAHGVKCHPLSWHRQSPGPPGLVLGYAAGSRGVIADGVARLGRALRSLR